MEKLSEVEIKEFEEIFICDLPDCDNCEIARKICAALRESYKENDGLNGKLDRIREIVGTDEHGVEQGYTAAYDVMNDIRFILDEDKP